MIKKLWSLILFIILLLGVNSASATNWYVKSNGSTGTGADWNNAWSVTKLNSSWASIANGDTVWIAGGTYTTQLTVSKNAAAASRVYIMRPRTTDAVPVAATGWSSAFDSQIIFNVNGDAISLAGSYCTVDGRIYSGIKVNVPNLSSQTSGVDIGGTSNVVASVECGGPGRRATYVCYIVGFIFSGNGGMATNCYFHDFNENGIFYNDSGSILDHCTFSANGCADGNEDIGGHPNMIDYNGSSGMTMRYCIWSDWKNEGFHIWTGFELGHSVGTGPMYIYGNIFQAGNQDLLTPNVYIGLINSGPVYFYNNDVFVTPVTMGRGINDPQIPNFAAGSQARNNIYWLIDLQGFFMGAWDSRSAVLSDRDYEFASSALQAGNPSGIHCVLSGVDPFVNYAGGDFHIVSTIGSTYPRNKGVALPAPFNIDRDGNVRGADGTWDIGAYEYVTTGPVAPTITVRPANQSVIVGDSATFTVTATGTAPLTYQWRLNGSTIVGATLASYTKSNCQLADNGGVYSVIVSNSSGTATSADATLTVTSGVAPSISVQPANTSVSIGNSATFTVTASGTATLTYQWKLAGSPIAGATLSSYTKSNCQLVDSGGVYSVTVSNGYGTVTSSDATLTVTGVAPSISVQPANQSTTVGNSATFTVTASGTAPLTYQWNLTSSPIAGATLSSYTKNNCLLTDSGGIYSVTVANGYGNISSGNAVLTVSTNYNFTNKFFRPTNLRIGTLRN